MNLLASLVGILKTGILQGIHQSLLMLLNHQVHFIHIGVKLLV